MTNAFLNGYINKTADEMEQLMAEYQRIRPKTPPPLPPRAGSTPPPLPAPVRPPTLPMSNVVPKPVSYWPPRSALPPPLPPRGATPPPLPPKAPPSIPPIDLGRPASTNSPAPPTPPRRPPPLPPRAAATPPPLPPKKIPWHKPNLGLAASYGASKAFAPTVNTPAGKVFGQGMAPAIMAGSMWGGGRGPISPNDMTFAKKPQGVIDTALTVAEPAWQSWAPTNIGNTMTGLQDLHRQQRGAFENANSYNRRARDYIQGYSHPSVSEQQSEGFQPLPTPGMTGSVSGEDIVNYGLSDDPTMGTGPSQLPWNVAGRAAGDVLDIGKNLGQGAVGHFKGRRAAQPPLAKEGGMKWDAAKGIGKGIGKGLYNTGKDIVGGHVSSAYGHATRDIPQAADAAVDKGIAYGWGKLKPVLQEAGATLEQSIADPLEARINAQKKKMAPWAIAAMAAPILGGALSGAMSNRSGGQAPVAPQRPAPTRTPYAMRLNQ